MRPESITYPLGAMGRTYRREGMIFLFLSLPYKDDKYVFLYPYIYVLMVLHSDGKLQVRTQETCIRGLTVDSHHRHTTTKAKIFAQEKLPLLVKSRAGHNKQNFTVRKIKKGYPSYAIS